MLHSPVNLVKVVVLAPAIVRLLGNLHLADRIDPRLSLSYQYLNLAKLGDMFGFMSFGTHYQSSQNYHDGWTNSMGESQMHERP